MVSWVEENENNSKSILDFYRIIHRKRLSLSGERTAIPIIAPKKVSHLNTLVSTCFKDKEIFKSISSLMHSICFDYFIKSMGISDLTTGIMKIIPVLELDELLEMVFVRVALLNAVNDFYAEFWEEFYSSKWNKYGWALDKVKSKDLFMALEKKWKKDNFLKTDLDRRQALVEIDVLISMKLKISLNDLLTIYRIQFSVLNQNDKETYYDQSGRIVFTPSKGLVGIGLARNAGPRDPSVIIEYPDGKKESKPLGWTEAQKLPDGTKIHRTILDDTQPGGPVERVITYTSPWYLPNREEDYKQAWDVFTARFKAQEGV